MNTKLCISIVLVVISTSCLGQSLCPFSYKYIIENKLYIGLIELKDLKVDTVYDIKLDVACKEPVEVG